ncbi:MAG: T9SS type A sorting domain-containing protein [Saprospiraceae bacterium]|nr:T9SS type A sorting domain-containing protein [Saprospiraceae bacterium]
MKLLFNDIDGDGDKDVLMAGIDSVDKAAQLTYKSITYFLDVQENIGSKYNPVFAPRQSYMQNFPYPDGYFIPSIGDLNHDGLLDFIVCCAFDSSFNLKPQYYKKIPSSGNSHFEINDSDTLQLDYFVRGSIFIPEMTDLDMDGDMDLLMCGFHTEESPITYRTDMFYSYQYAKNEGTKLEPVFNGWFPDPYGLSTDSLPTLSITGDIDNDLDIDVLALTQMDTFEVFTFHENIPQPNGKPFFQNRLNNPFGLPKANRLEAIFAHSLVDIDADGDLDLFAPQRMLSTGTGIGFYKNNLCEPSILEMNASICAGDSVVVAGQVFMTAGEYFISVEKVNRCDSTIHFSLTVLPSSQINLESTLCFGEDITVGGNSFSESGQFTVVLPNQAGCDSIVSLNLTVFPEVEQDLQQAICQGDELMIGNQIFTESGQFEIMLTNANGCDSIVHLTLEVLPNSATALQRTICQGEEVNVGTMSFSQSGSYEVNLVNSNGCDSIVSLDLTVNPTYRSNLEKAICEGNSIVIGNQSFSQPGQYEVTLTSISGCDSVIVLNLSFIPLNLSVTQLQNVLKADMDGLQYQWFDCSTGTAIPGATAQSFSPTANGNYAVIITDANACADTSLCVDFVLSSTTGFNLADRINIFPTPTHEYFSIYNNTGHQMTSINILNSLGQHLKTITNPTSEKISMAGMEEGNYILELSIGGQKVSKKLTVVRE